MTRRTTLFYCYLFLIYTFCVHLPSLNVEVFYMHLYNKEQAIKRMNQLTTPPSFHFHYKLSTRCILYRGGCRC